MPPSTEGHAIAIARIADEKKNRTGFLDLGRLGLTEVPEELFELEHLRGLNWGRSGLMSKGNRMRRPRIWPRIRTRVCCSRFIDFRA